MGWEEYRANYMLEQERADSWRGFQNRFMELAREEQGRTEAITKGNVLRRMDKVLRAYCDYKDHPERVFVPEEVRSFYETLGVELTSEDLSKIQAKMLEWAELEKKAGLKAPETGRWTYGTGAVSENLRERVRLCVAEAGRALPDCHKGTDPEDFWLHRLYLDLLKNNSDLLFCGTKEGGMILSVCVASATFCARFERQALAQSEPGHRTEAERPKTGGKETEPSRVQNNAKTAEGAENDPALNAEEWRRSAEPSHLPNFVNFSMPAGSTHEEVIHEIAKRLRWRVGPLPGQLRESPYPRGRTVFGSANDILDQIVAAHKNLYWAENDGALRFVVKNTPVEHAALASRVENDRKIAQSTASGASNTRKTFLTPILEKKGFSVHDWANKANVDWHTADNYLNGKTNPYQSTRKRLADALSIGVEELPA